MWVEALKGPENEHFDHQAGGQTGYPPQPGQKLICSIGYAQFDRAAYAYCRRQRGVRAEAAARTLFGWER